MVTPRIAKRPTAGKAKRGRPPGSKGKTMAKGREPNSGKKIPRKPTPVMEGSAKDDSSGGEQPLMLSIFDPLPELLAFHLSFVSQVPNFGRLGGK